MKKGIIFLMVFLLSATLSMAQVYYLQVPGTAFRGDDNTEDYMNYAIFGMFRIDGIAWKKTDAEPLYNRSVAPIYFPHDLKYVKRLTVRYVDNSTTGNVTVQLRKVDFNSGNTYTVFSVSSATPDASPSERFMSTTTGANKFIDNSRFGWWLEFVPNEAKYDLRIKNIKITYRD